MGLTPFLFCITLDFLKRKLAEYETIRSKIEALQRELAAWDSLSQIIAKVAKGKI